MVLCIILGLVCRYINALEVASGNFSRSLKKIAILRKEDELSTALRSNDRESNCETLFYMNTQEKQPQFVNVLLMVMYNLMCVSGQKSSKRLIRFSAILLLFIYLFLLLDFCFTVIILCGTPDDIMDLKNSTMDSDHEVAFLLIDLYKSVNSCFL